jgi:flagellar hook-length control protein FliK
VTSIGNESRGLPAMGDTAVASLQLGIGEGASPADMFGAIIAGMSVEALSEDPAAPFVEGDTPAPAPEANAAASVVQLLALTVKQQAKALTETEGEELEPNAEAVADGQTSIAIESDTAPEIAPAVPQIAPAVSKVAQAAPPTTIPSAQPQVRAPAAQPQVGKKSQAAPAVEDGKAPKPEAKSPVALAIAELMQATRQLGPPQGRRAAPEPVVRGEGTAPANFGQEVKQVVHAALSSMHAQSVPLPLEVSRPSETMLEPLMAEPQLDPSEFAIERQLDVSAEGEWLDSLARDIARTAGEGGTLRFKLNPENLGTLRVEITPQANGSVVRLTADTDAARTIIADAQTRLIAEAKANGVRISETHVDLGGQNPSGDPRRQNAAFEEAPIRTARFLRDQEESDGKPTPSKSERYA